MKRIYKSEETYLSGLARHEMDPDFTFLLFRQDFDGAEYIFFDEEDIPSVVEGVNCGLIPIHGSCSILYGRSPEDLDKVPLLGCYTTVKEMTDVCEATR